MDPTEDERKAMGTLKSVFVHAIADDKTVAGSLLALTGAKADVEPVVVGIMKKAEFETILQSWKVPSTPPRVATFAEIGAVRLVGHMCRVIAGETVEELKKQLASSMTSSPSIAAAGLSSAAGRKVKLSAIISQIDDTEIFLTDEREG